MDYYVWVGPRECDCMFEDLFKEHICYFSDDNYCTTREANIYGKTFNIYVEQRMKQILEKHPNAKFIFYNQKIAYCLPDRYLKHIKCINEIKIINILNDKIYMRYWIGNYVSVVPAILIHSKHLSYKELENQLCYSEEYIVQQNNTSGGFGTFILSKDNKMLDYFHKNINDLLIVSPYLKQSYSINVNAIISSNNIKIFMPSLQIIQINKNRLLYHGADFIAAQSLDQDIMYEMECMCKIILRQIQKLGYKGIIGLDFIVHNKKIYFQEINPRYQASSFLISKALKNENLPSLLELNLKAFQPNSTIDIDVIEKLKINFSFYKYYYSDHTKHLYHILKQRKSISYISNFIMDGWHEDIIPKEDSYCYGIIFNKNISSINFDGGINLYSNISGEEEFIKTNLDSNIGLKIALLNQGCILLDEARFLCEQNGIIKDAVFNSIDLKLENRFQVNVPMNINFNNLSPFIIGIHEKNLALFYYDLFISNISIELKPQWDQMKTSTNVPYNKIAYLATDRLRIKHESTCIYKKQGKSCKFCNIPKSNASWTQNDIDEVIAYLFEEPNFRHVLIGGGSGTIEDEPKHIIYITQQIRKRNAEMPIYIMSLPPYDDTIIEKYYRAGVSEVAFNIEIWNRSIAQQVMPGKGNISIDKYMSALKKSTELWGKNGNVRTALIVGLNSNNDLIDGINTLCENGIQPMLSVFRPMENTPLDKLVPPSNTELLHTYTIAEKVCQRYSLHLGPSCDACKNNMLAI